MYTAQKRQGDSCALHDPDIVGGDPLIFSDWEHSERQLAIQLTMVSRGGGAAAINSAAHDAAPIGALPLGMPNVTAQQVGEFHIYTRQSPCPSRGSDNNHFSCIEYYAALQKIFPLGTVFHIYFNKINIDPNYIVNNSVAATNLINAIAELMNRPLPPIALINRFEITPEGVLRYNQNTMTADNTNWINAETNLGQFTNRVNTAFEDSSLSNNDKILIFNAVFAIPSVNYHLIQ